MVLGLKTSGLLGDGRSHGDELEGGVVGLTGLDRPEEVGDAEPGLLLLAGEG